MSETLVIRLRAAEEAPASWLVVDGNGARSGPLQSGPVADALNLAAERRVVLLVPGTEVALAEPELPLRSNARLAQVVPYALEEQLASDVDTLHFAVGTRTVGAVGTPVAIVARGLMQRWHDQCEAAGIHADAAYADSAAVPAGATGCTLLLDESLLYVRRADALPYVLDATDVAGGARSRAGRAGKRARKRARTSRSTPAPRSTNSTARRSRRCATAPPRCRSSCLRTVPCPCSRPRPRPAPVSTCCREPSAPARRSALGCANGDCRLRSPPPSRCCSSPTRPSAGGS